MCSMRSLLAPVASSVTHVTPSNLGDKKGIFKIGMDICACLDYKTSQLSNQRKVNSVLLVERLWWAIYIYILIYYNQVNIWIGGA